MNLLCASRVWGAIKAAWMLTQNPPSLLASLALTAFCLAKSPTTLSDSAEVSGRRMLIRRGGQCSACQGPLPKGVTSTVLQWSQASWALMVASAVPSFLLCCGPVTSDAFTRHLRPLFRGVLLCGKLHTPTDLPLLPKVVSMEVAPLEPWRSLTCTLLFAVPPATVTDDFLLTGSSSVSLLLLLCPRWCCQCQCCCPCCCCCSCRCL